MDYNQLSGLEIVIALLEEKHEPTDIVSLMKEALKLKGLNSEDSALLTRLYTDLIASSKFVFLGDGKWDLKENQSLDVYDRDGSSYYANTTQVEESAEEDNQDGIDNDGFDSTDSDYDDEDEDYLDDEDEDEDESSLKERYDDDDFDDEDEDDYLDEAKYNALMDDYEDMYDKD